MNLGNLCDITLLISHLRLSCQNCVKVERCSCGCSIIPKLKRICPEVLLNGSGESIPKCV